MNVSYARQLLGDAAVDILITDGVDVKTVAHAGRSANRRQKAALLASWECEIRGCCRIRRLEVDHTDGYANTKLTAIQSLGPRCEYHHDLKSHKKWVDGPKGPDGKREIHPP